MSMPGGELFPFVIYFGLFCTLILILGFPLWFLLQVSSLRRSIHYLREDIEDQEMEISQLRNALEKTESPTEQMDDFGEIILTDLICSR